MKIIQSAIKTSNLKLLAFALFNPFPLNPHQSVMMILILPAFQPFAALYLTPVILQLPLKVSGVQLEERQDGNSKTLRTNILLIEPAGIFMTGWCVSMKGMWLWAAKSTLQEKTPQARGWGKRRSYTARQTVWGK